MTGPVGVRWLWAFLDTPRENAERSWAFWSAVTRSTTSARRGADGEFATLIPATGDPWIKVQSVAQGAGGIHLDLDVDDPRAASATARELGATVIAEHGEDGYVVLRSPGGFVFCLTHVGGQSRQVRVGESDLLDQVCLDVPSSRYAAETAFWESLTGWEWAQSDVPEFSYLRRPEGMPLRLLFQRLGEEDGAVRAHVDLACLDRAVSEERCVQAGAAVVVRRSFWTVLTDPCGREFCLTDRTPVQSWVADTSG